MKNAMKHRSSSETYSETYSGIAKKCQEEDGAGVTTRTKGQPDSIPGEIGKKTDHLVIFEVDSGRVVIVSLTSD